VGFQFIVSPSLTSIAGERLAMGSVEQEKKKNNKMVCVVVCVGW